MRDASPLRYPGGKWRLAAFFTQLIRLNALDDCQYVEPYAGGASLGLSLLFSGLVTEIHLNDLDPAIHAFWHSVLNRKSEFLTLLAETAVTPAEWHKQKKIYSQGLRAGRFALGFATFFLNRTCHSGILNGGIIGGNSQDGPWKIDARFNLPELERRIERIGRFRKKIHLYNEDALDFLRGNRFSRNAIKYLDPPYYKAGHRLYLNSYESRDHNIVKRYITGLRTHWVVSYDDVPEIRKVYEGVRSRRITLLHTARDTRIGQEVLFFPPHLRIPRFH
jgi:DNA adenine methylase